MAPFYRGGSLISRVDGSLTSREGHWRPGKKGRRFSKQEAGLISGVALTRDKPRADNTPRGGKRPRRGSRPLKRAMSRIESPRAVRNRA